MSEKTITHEIKLPKSLTLILAILAFGVLANAFAPVLSVKGAMADLSNYDTLTLKVSHSGYITTN